MRNFILYNKESLGPLTARDTAEKAWSHSYHDARRIGKTYMYSSAAILASLVGIGMMSTQSSDPQGFMTFWLTSANVALSATMGLALYESRKKAAWLRDTFNSAAQGFNERDTKLSAKFSDALHERRPAIAEYAIDLRKYPIQSFFALSLGIAGALTGQPAIMALGASISMLTVLMDEESRTENVSEKAHKTKKMIELCNKMGLN